MDEPRYTVLQRANGDPAKAGELLDWHCKHLHETDSHTGVMVAAMGAEIADLTAQLDAAKQRLADHMQARDRDAKWDGYCLLDWLLNAPENQGRAAKSVKLTRGYTVGARHQNPLLKIVDPEPLMTALPECCELKLKEGEAKKLLTVTDAGVVFADTGELVPEGCVEVTRAEGEKYFVKRPDGSELELTMFWQPEYEADKTDGEDAASEAEFLTNEE